jgi:NAD(P)-dependent dehydrogenase (short-subunit alcohol dehydrogenase family)
MKVPEELQFIVNARLPQARSDASMEGRVCVITGATSGVGLAAARRLARGGARIVMVCRDPEKTERLRRRIASEFGVRVDGIFADFAKLDEVRAAGKAILRDHPRIDVLINNVGMHATTRVLSEAGTELVFCVNHLASFLLTCLLLERMKESAPSRIIQVNSHGHRFGGLDLGDIDWSRRRYRGMLGYGAAKTAQLLTVWEFAERLEGTGVTINAMHPGAVRTNIGLNNGPLYRWYSRHLIWHFLKNPQISGEALYFLAAAPELEETSGRYYNQTIEETPAGHALDREVGREVWELSQRLVGVRM